MDYKSSITLEEKSKKEQLKELEIKLQTIGYTKVNIQHIKKLGKAKCIDDYIRNIEEELEFWNIKEEI